MLIELCGLIRVWFAATSSFFFYLTFLVNVNGTWVGKILWCNVLFLSAYIKCLNASSLYYNNSYGKKSFRYPLTCYPLPFSETHPQQIAGYVCIHLKHMFTSSEMRNSMHHDLQIFHIDKEWFYVGLDAARCYEWQRWLQLSLQSRKHRKKNKNRKCMHTVSETLKTFWVCM